MIKLHVVSAERYNQDREEMAHIVLGVARGKAGIDAILREEFPGAILTEKSYGFTVELPQDRAAHQGWKIEVEAYDCELSEAANLVFVVTQSYFDQDRDYSVSCVLGVATGEEGVRQILIEHRLEITTLNLKHGFMDADVSNDGIHIFCSGHQVQ